MAYRDDPYDRRGDWNDRNDRNWNDRNRLAGAGDRYDRDAYPNYNTSGAYGPYDPRRDRGDTMWSQDRDRAMMSREDWDRRDRGSAWSDRDSAASDRWNRDRTIIEPRDRGTAWSGSDMSASDRWDRDRMTYYRDRGTSGSGMDRSDWDDRSMQQRDEWRPYGDRGYVGSYGVDRYATSRTGDEWRRSDTRGEYAGVGPRDYQRNPVRIAEDVNDRLTMHGNIDATDIEVTVENGEVTLKGYVADRDQKRMAEDAAAAVSGVRDVNNQLKIRS